MTMDGHGNDTVPKLRDHFPYGESWYNASGDKLMFTSYERDAESGNDYAQARSYVNRLGRFSSLDPLPGNISDPQSLNRYSYVRNLPVMATDPTGMLGCVYTSANVSDGDTDDGSQDSHPFRRYRFGDQDPASFTPFCPSGGGGGGSPDLGELFDWFSTDINNILAQMGGCMASMGDDPVQSVKLNCFFRDPQNGSGGGGGSAGRGNPGQLFCSGPLASSYCTPPPPPCIPSSSLNWLQSAQLNAAQFYANVLGGTVGFGVGLDAGGGIGPKSSAWNLGVGGSASTFIVADSTQSRGILNSYSLGPAGVKMASGGSYYGGGAAAGPSLLYSPFPISQIKGKSGLVSAGGGIGVLGGGGSLSSSGVLTLTVGVGVGAEGAISPQGAKSSFTPICPE